MDGEGEIGRRGRPRSAAAHTAILDAVVPLIQAVGYDAFSLEALAARAGVGKATIYRRWSSKEDVAVEALQRFVGAIPPPDTGALRGDLAAALGADATLQSDPQTRRVLSSLLAAAARSPRMAAAVQGGFVAARERVLATVLQRAVGRGELPADLDVGLAVQLCAGPLLYRTLVSGEPSDPAVVARLVDLLIAGLTARSSGGAHP